MSEQLYTRTEIEDQFGICANSLRQLVKDGEFPAPIQIGRRLLRWRKSTVDQFIAAQDEKLNGHLITNPPRKKLKPVKPKSTANS